MDERLRSLEKQLQSGDVSAATPLLMTKNRSGTLSRAALELLAGFQFEPAIQLYDGLNIDHPPKITKTLWQEVGQKITCKIAAATLNYPFLEIFNSYSQWEKLVGWKNLEIQEFKNDIETILLAIQNLRAEPLDPKYAKVLSKWDKKFIDYLPDLKEDQAYDAELEHSPLTTELINNSGRGWTRIYAGIISQRILYSLYHLILLLRELILALKPAKINTFYKIIEDVFSTVGLFHIEKQSRFKLFRDDVQDLYSDRYREHGTLMDDPVRKKIKVEQIRQRKLARKFVLEWTLPKVLELLLTSETLARSTPTARDSEFYDEQLKSKRYTFISVQEEEDDDGNLITSKLRNKLSSPSDYFKFLVWTSSKPEAIKSAEKVLYKLYGFIPAYRMYPRIYANKQMIEKGLHEDYILDNEDITIPDDVFRVNSSNNNLYRSMDGEAIRQLRNQELLRIQEIQASRPDLY